MMFRALAPWAAVVVLGGCTCGGPLPGADAGPSVDAGADAGTLWAAWSEISAQLKASPDHLVAGADAVVATRDPVKIHAFVRDQIATYPPSDDGFANAPILRRWGTKATLRGGAGTPREKADLLVSLYGRAGFDAGVVVGVADPARLDGQKVLFRAIDRSVVLSYTDADAARWRAALGGSPPQQVSVIDPMGVEADQVAAALEAQLPSTLVAPPFDFTLGPIPLVAVQIGGEVKYANPIAPAAALGDAFTTGTPVAAAAASTLQRVRVQLNAARANAPYTHFPLLDATFDADQVVGRRVQLSFVAPGGVDQLLRTRSQDLEAVVPVLAVTGTDLTAAERSTLGVAGDLVSLAGDVYGQTADGGLTLNGEALGPIDGDPASIAKVASVEVAANPSAFPRVQLSVSPLDAAGNGVPRLGAAAFKVEEDGVPVSFTLRRNELRPRVVLLFDASTSVPAAFRDAGAVSVGTDIVQQLYAAHPTAEVRVATVYFGARFATNSWATTLAEAQAQVQTLSSSGGLANSDLWNALTDVQTQHPTVVILITDGAASDSPTPTILSALGTGAAVLSLAVGTVDAAAQAMLDQVAALTGGRVVPATLATEAVTAAAAEIAARTRQHYLFSYRAAATGGAMRTVKVTINGKAGTTVYAPPAAPVTPTAISGLYLSITVDGRTHDRTLAGFGLAYSTGDPTITRAMLDDVRSLFLGGVTVSVEGAAPTQSLILDEWIAGRQTLRPLLEAAETRDLVQITAALRNGFSVSPPRLPLAHAHLSRASGATWLTFETGLRVASLVTKFPVGKGPVQRQLDLFALTQWRTAAADPRVAWQKTLAATAGLAVMEKHLLAGTSTLEGLQGKALTLVTPIEASNQAGLTGEERLAWGAVAAPFSPEYRLLVPLKPGPFWAVHRPTGTVIGMLPNGTGGGDEACGAYDDANVAIQALGVVGSLMGASVGPWVALAQWEVKYITIATIVIGGGNLGTGGTTPSNPAIDMACGMFGDALGRAIPRQGDLIPGYGDIDSLVGLYNVANPDHAAPTLCNPIPSGPCH